MKRKPKLTAEHRYTICWSLRCKFSDSMNRLDMTGSCASHASHFLRAAGETWDAYKAFTGSPMHEAAVGL